MPPGFKKKVCERGADSPKLQKSQVCKIRSENDGQEHGH
jgi:hypothetical protein